ncbi:MAG: PTS sugar transporter subunit IIB [Lachnospiraceae bacterium]|nr:PTS sugar transporter subunit IIB [Lachnospiraceae bacterium]MDO4942294.1 PTS sugar transporter subunit IIB [Lachnospiraceae bacterium]
MAKEVKVLVACGSGVATSTIAQEAIKEIAKDAGVKIRLMKGTIAEVPMKQKDVDVVFTTANYRKSLEKPHLSVFGLVSGINKAGTAKKVEELLKKLAAE